MKKIKLLLLIIVLATMIVTPIIIIKANSTEYDWTKEYVNEIVKCEGYDFYVYTSVDADGVVTTEAKDIKVITFYLENDVITYLVWHKDDANQKLGYDIDWELAYEN